MTDLEKIRQEFTDDPLLTINDLIEQGYTKSTVYAAHARAFPRTPSGVMNIVTMGDLHSGHKVGLTPPEWFVNPHKCELRSQQEEMWWSYVSMLKEIGKIDVLFVNGDLIDGKGKRSGGTELLTTDRHEQCDIATRCILEANAKKVFITYGTPYHTGNSEDFETIIARSVCAEKIADQIFIDLNGIVFDVKHHIGGSGVPHGRSTSLGKSKLWNSEWAEKGNQPKAQVLIRSHVHYANHTGNSSFLAMTLPALQGPDTKYGGRRCEGTVDFGLANFKIKKGDTVGDMIWKVYTKNLESFNQKLLVA